eukprot:Seg1489.3 transcript_id=Seg1489.3/GoldUCD/mRNA.D3Y31 product="Bactericidal permeability-increasing protein" protein_id=Seg1489.3/GoldUCD/D3Y31
MGSSLPLLTVLLVTVTVVYTQQRGAQLRLTAKGLDYAVKQAMQVLQKDLSGKRLPDYHGSGGGFQIYVRNLRLNSIGIGNQRLAPSSSGLNVAVGGVNVGVSGRFTYEKRVWKVTIRDSVNINARASGVSFSMSLRLGKRSDGRPTIGVHSCNAHIGGLSTSISGSKASWLYRIIAWAFEGKLKSEIAKGICQGATDGVNTKVAALFAQFPVQQPIEDLAIIDYRLTSAPAFNSQIMDVFVRGEFLPRNQPNKHSNLPVPAFPTSSDDSKMIYFWVTDYTLNTAANVIQNTGLLKLTLSAQSDFPKVVKDLLNTNVLALVVPELAARFPNRPLKIALHSHKAPEIIVEDGKVDVILHASAGLMVELVNGTLFDAFSIHLDVKAGGSVGLTGTRIHGKLSGFSFTLKIFLSHIGHVDIPVDDPFIQSIVKDVLIPTANVILEKGFPLPTIPYVALRQPAITFKKGVIRIGVDCLFASKLIF